MKLFTSLHLQTLLHQGKRAQRHPSANKQIVIQRFVETGDERCPIAATWLTVSSLETADDPESFWPATGMFSCGGQFLFLT